MFLGIYKATDNDVYHLHGDDAYNPNLPLKLIYRKRITPYKVYSSGVLEWIVLDKLPKYSSEIIWMLIYRKMKGKRGNTMLFPWESQRLINMLAKENDGKTINYNNYYFE